jgi:DNA-binding XRE family transcriptional regulator
MARREEAATVREYGGLVLARRRRSRVNQRALAATVGVSVQTVANIEAGRVNPGLAVFSRMVLALGGELRVIWRRKR